MKRWRVAAFLAALLLGSVGGQRQPEELTAEELDALPTEFLKAIQYAVVGQQKSGTSTLWNNIVSHPQIKWVGPSKELFYFNNDDPSTTACDADIAGYQRQAAFQRLQESQVEILIGDWSTTYFSCICCPMVLKTLNPDMKIMVVLRDPVQRTLSRFLEQKRNVDFPFYVQVQNHTFASYVEQEVTAIEKCVAHAARFQTRNATADGPPFTGWGAGMDMGEWMEAQCFARRNILGWSVYDTFLKNYFSHFPPSQTHVVYTNELAMDTVATMRKVETFLGVPPFEYDVQKAVLIFNSRECYHWHCGKDRKEISELRAAKSVAAQQEDTPFGIAAARLTAFFRPHMQQLFRWADQGLIAPVPAAWRKTYA